MARARAAVAAGRASAVVVPMHAHSGKRWAAAAAALLASVAAGAAAYEIHARLTQPPHVAPAARPSPAGAIAPAAPPASVIGPEQPDAPEPPAAVSGLSRAEAERAELRLLRAAPAAG